MRKCVLMNRFDFDNLKLNIKLADHLEFTYEFESMPLGFPCIAVYHIMLMLITGHVTE